MSRDGHHDPRAHALPVLQRLRFLDAAEQVAAGGDRRGGHVRRTGARLDLHVSLVVLRAGTVEQPLPERDVHLLGEHGDLQRQSAACVTTATTSCPT